MLFSISVRVCVPAGELRGAYKITFKKVVAPFYKCRNYRVC